MFWLRSTVGVSLVLPPFRIHVSHKLARCGSLTAESISIIVLDFLARVKCGCQSTVDLSFVEDVDRVEVHTR